MAKQNKVKIALANLRHEVKDTIKEKKITIVEKEKQLIDIDKMENLDTLNITQYEELNNKLKEKALEFVNFSVNGALWMGKHLQEVFELLDKDPSNQATYYNEYLKYINVNERTARRYRKRFLVFSKCESEHSKRLISTLSDDDIQFIDDNEDLLEKIENENLTKADFKNIKNTMLLELKNSEEAENTVVVPVVDFSNFTDKVSDIQVKLNALKDKNVDQDTLKDLEKYLNKIEKILQKI
ncbi:hypothetical protein HUW86_08360 (plasmid) [Fusobacterium sp. SB021]|uniref:hypothetical protein n=1 Tax=Fusobacterium sp. SB021 TaxID=2744227 RepID=UPI003CEEEB47